MKKMLVFLSVVFAIPFLFLTVASTSAYATCYICGGTQWTGQCLSASAGGSICTIGQGGGGACNIYGSCCENCGCSWGCGGPWCCTDGKANKKTCPTLKKSSFTIGETIFAAPQTTLQPQQRYDSTFGFKEFMALVEQGKFDGATVYMGDDNPILKGIMKTPITYWKSFTQKTVLTGWQQDKHLDPKLQKPGTPQVLIEVETKTGHKFTIHPNPSTPQKPPKNTLAPLGPTA